MLASLPLYQLRKIQIRMMILPTLFLEFKIYREFLIHIVPCQILAINFWIAYHLGSSKKSLMTSVSGILLKRP